MPETLATISLPGRNPIWEMEAGHPTTHLWAQTRAIDRALAPACGFCIVKFICRMVSKGYECRMYKSECMFRWNGSCICMRLTEFIQQYLLHMIMMGKTLHKYEMVLHAMENHGCVWITKESSRTWPRTNKNCGLHNLITSELKKESHPTPSQNWPGHYGNTTGVIREQEIAWRMTTYTILDGSMKQVLFNSVRRQYLSRKVLSGRHWAT